MPASNQENHEKNKFWVHLPPFTGSMTLIGVCLIFFLVSGIAGLTAIYMVKSTAEKLNKDFIQSHKELLITLNETAEHAVQKGKYSGLIQVMQKIKSHQEQAKNTSSIKDIFYLKRNGEVAAHTDITQLTVNAKSTISKVNSIYNNESFHHSLLGDRGVVYTLVYPYDTYNKNRKYLYFFKKVLPENYFEAIDFTMPVYSGKKSTGTLHIVATRTVLDTLLEHQLQTLSFIWMGGIFAGFLIILVLHVYASQKVNGYEQIITAIEIPVAREHQMEDEIRFIDQKLNALGSLSGTRTSYSGQRDEDPRAARAVKEAILIKSE